MSTDSCISGVRLAASDILKVLIVSARPNERHVSGLLRGWQQCKQALLKASNDLNRQRGKTFWGKVVVSKVTYIACCEDPATVQWRSALK